MAVYKQAKSKYWWFKFNWNGETIRESTKQANKRIAEQIEAARKTGLAKGEVGIRDQKPVPTLRDFAEKQFLPFVRSTFAAKIKTRLYYENGVQNLLRFDRLGGERLDAITTDRISDYSTQRQAAPGRSGKRLQVASLNRELQVLRRMFRLAEEWGEVAKALPKVKMLSGETHRERVLTAQEEDLYFKGASSELMERHANPILLREVATILLDCGLRPEECFRLRVENVADGNIEVHFGKTENARRRIPMTPRVAAVLEMRLSALPGSGWIFPAQTASGHIEPSTLKKQHLNALSAARKIMREAEPEGGLLQPFELYTLRHTCLTRWAPHMDPWTLAYLAGHRDMNITKRYVHPQEHTIRNAMEKAREVTSRHTSGHTVQIEQAQPTATIDAVH
jgi:integrase